MSKLLILAALILVFFAPISIAGAFRPSESSPPSELVDNHLANQLFFNESGENAADEPLPNEAEQDKADAPDENEQKEGKFVVEDIAVGETVYINVYRRDECGVVTDEIEVVEVPIYRSKNPVGEMELLTKLSDNTAVKVILVDDGKVQIEYRTGKSGWVDGKYVRKDKFEYIDCKACDKKGSVACPACKNGKIEIEDKVYFCKVCKGEGKIRCIHCKGLGKTRKK